MSEIRDLILARYTASDDYLDAKRELWDEYESIFLNQVNDQISDDTKSQVFDPKLSTMAIERSNRVMSQLPAGKVRGMSKNDEAMSKLMNLTLEKYILPNADSQFDFLTKSRMVDLYSSVYGIFFVFVDWTVKPNGYIGPDMWLLNIRDVFPQVGAVSVEDSDHIIIRTWKNKSYFESLKNDTGFKNIPKLLEKIEQSSGDKSQRSQEHKSKRELTYSEPIATNGSGQYSVLSMYEGDRWVDYVPFIEDVIRDIDNPQDNGELPVVAKYAIPLLDDFMAMGDFERGKSMQYALNSNWNLYFDGIKFSMNPPVLINKDNVASAQSIQFTPAAKWLMRGPGGSQAAQTLNLSPQGINSFNNTYQVITGALLNQFGTTFTSTSSSTNPEMGKTPEALKQQSQRENSRDNADRFHMEQFLVKVINRMCNLLANKQPKALSIRLFPDEIEELQRQYPEFENQYNDNTGKLTIRKSTFKGVFDYEIVPGSTFAADQQEQQNNLLSVLELFVKNPNLIGYLQQAEGKTVEIGELITRIMSNSGIMDWDKIIKDTNQEGGGNGEQEAAVLAQALQNISSQTLNQVPPQNAQTQTGNPGGPAGQIL